MRGGAGNENMGGSAGNDTIDGGRGTDTANYSSLGGPVSLGAFGVLNKGGLGIDTLIGAGGSDNLTGGAGADVFKYISAAESAAGISKRDTITDFQLGIDKLDLTAIDANATLANDQAFSFLGNAGSFTSAGQLRYEVIGGNLLLFGNLNTNLGTSEFELQLTGLNFITAADIFP
jgi:serralysin